MLKKRNTKKYIILLVICFSFAIGVSALPNKSERHFNEALKAYKDGKLLNALDYLLQSLSEEQDQPRVNVLIEEITNKIKEERVEELFSQGINHYNEERYLEAVTTISEASSLAPRDKKIKAYLKKSQKALEKEVMQRQEFVSASSASRFMAIGDTHRDKKEYFTTFDWYKHALASESTAFERYRVKRRIKSLDRLMRKIIKKRDAYQIDEYHYAQAYLFYRVSNMKAAIEEWEKVMALNPKHKEVAEYLRIAKGSSGEEEEKKKAARIAEIQRLLKEGKEAVFKNDYAKASGFFKEVLTIDAENITAKTSLDEISIKKEQYRIKKEKEKRKKLIRQTEEQRIARQKEYSDARRRKEEDKRKKAESERKKLSVREREALVQDLYNKGLRAYALGKLKEAIKFWNEILKYEPDNERVKRNLERTKKELKGR